MTAIDERRVALPAIAQIEQHPVHALLVSMPTAFFVGTLLTDITYYATAEMMWADFSAWLVSVGFVIGILAALAGLADFARNRGIRAQTSPRLRALGVLLILIVAFFNMLVHTRDAWTSVVPIGLVLSVITVLILPVTGWLDWSISYRQSVGVVR